MSQEPQVHDDDADAMVRGEWYTVGARLEAVQARAQSLQAEVNRPGVEESSLRSALAELLGMVGEGVTIRPPLYVDYGVNLAVGAGSYINYGLVALDCAPITIGERCLLGPGVQLLTPEHPLDAALREAGVERALPITLGRNVWLGGGAIVLGGVTIGDHAVIGAGSVVTRDVPARAVAVGAPARVVRTIDDD